jgi:fructokinase
MTDPAVMIGLGEVLWDLLPSGKVLGGAPANFAYMANVLGDQGIVASRVGNDDLGKAARAGMQQLGLSTAYLQHDDSHGTGTATVSIDDAGQPSFTIRESVAWDFLDWSPEWEELSARADVICFGSLAQRSEKSALTIERFLKHASSDTLRIFDVNLREPFYNQDVLHRSFQHADIVKLNDYELLEVSNLFNLGTGTHEILAQRLLRLCDLRLVCVTCGSRGSLLVTREDIIKHNGFQVTVADAIGAGDAFTACLAHQYLRGRALEEISETANRFASWVATQTGATPYISTEKLRSLMDGATLP